MYNCMQQYIMQTINPSVQKDGKKMAGFVKETSHKEMPTLLIKGLKAKFSQVGFYKEFLKSMGTKKQFIALPSQWLTRMSGTPTTAPKTFWEKHLQRWGVNCKLCINPIILLVIYDIVYTLHVIVHIPLHRNWSYKGCVQGVSHFTSMITYW